MADLGLAKSKSPEKQASLFPGLGSVSCSVCLELVTDAGERSIAKLKCGHHFHLDCIGSAFNAKGLMQCPNCRRVEEGQWLYANGCRHFEDYTVDGLSYEDDYEVYAGIADLFHPHEELQFGHLHWGAYPSLSHQHVSVTLEGSNPPAGGYPDLVVNVLYGEHGGSSNPVHTCPYLTSQMVQHPRQMQILDGNFGIPHNHEVAAPMQGGNHVGGSSARTQRISVSDRNAWSFRGTGPLPSSNSAINTDYAEPPILTHERMRRSRAVSGNRVHGNYDMAFGQARLHRRFPGNSAGSSEVPSMTPYPHNHRLGEPVSSTQNAASPTLRHRLNGTSRRPRLRGFPVASVGGRSSDFPERGLGASWNMTSRIGGDYAGGLPGMDGVGWNGSAQGYSWQRDGHFGNPWGPYDMEPHWHPWFHNGSSSQSYGDVASNSYYENDFYGVDGQIQAELNVPSEEHLAVHSHGNGFPGILTFPQDGADLHLNSFVQQP
ncbi:hypothetical protein O6H91_15G078400 [Diphasiastrum complanatum]|uniref:Uncharacterized protein n=3 Tax=Diphasiastrum complanatum TaxID=34168 RepID=A0ACC2BJV5_DIPCM|nr:hypothetical protein O6H91_15G078400 [Diphasiastrum complanatum]KAJ7530084.1 hypothetical protein O6H91_15G078400 [Diphasiastrum complanatum]